MRQGLIHTFKRGIWNSWIGMKIIYFCNFFQVTGQFEKWDSYVCSVPVDALQKLMDCILHIGVKGEEKSYA